jgi:hypothetical protein
MTKNWKKFTAGKNFIFFYPKIVSYLSRGSIKNVQATEVLSPQKEHPALQNMKLLNFFYIFVGHFCPPVSEH